MKKDEEMLLSLSKPDFMRKKIIAAIKELLLTNPYQKITVKQVCELANISRSSFYHLFSDIEDALDWEFGRLFSVAIKNHPITDDWRKDIFNMASWFLQQIKEEGYFFRKIALDMSRVDYNSIFSRTRRRFVQMFFDYITDYLGTEPDERCAFEINFFVFGASDVIANCMIAQNETSADLVDRLTACVPEYLARVLDASSAAYKRQIRT